MFSSTIRDLSTKKIRKLEDYNGAKMNNKQATF